jgi:tetratricopeptide (TPR) repeat protein
MDPVLLYKQAMSRAASLAQLGQLDAALADYEAALALRPDRLLAAEPGHAGAFNNRGCLFLSLEHFAPALADFDSALAIDPRQVAALKNRGDVLLKLGRREDALASYDRLLALQPDHQRADKRRKLLAALARADAPAPNPDYADAPPIGAGQLRGDLAHFEETLLLYTL